MPPEIAIDLEQQTIRLFGVTYALALFRHLAFAPVGSRLEIVSRRDGVVTVHAADTQMPPAARA